MDQIRLLRYDLDDGEPTCVHIAKGDCPANRNELFELYPELPVDSIIKLSYSDKRIPWSLIHHFSSVDISVFRPHQNIKPRLTEDFSSDSLVREKACRLESRISSLEQSLDETTLQIKTERDLQLLTKQITFLANRLSEADRAEWVKRADQES